MRTKLIAGNWKMHNNPHQASILTHRLDQHLEPHEAVAVVICAPSIDLYPLSKELNSAKFSLGAQNLYPFDEGPYTGEVSAAMLRGLVSYSIIGHSERRLHFHEDDKLIAQKVAAALRHHIRPILCVGDTLLEREHGAARKVVTSQLAAGLAEVTDAEVGQVVVAYEPVWAISSGDGHGSFAKPDQVVPMIKAIRETLRAHFDPEAADRVQVLYGGSANADNCRAYLEIDGVDGLLVGGASLNYADFSAIVKVAQDLD
jgi:triosephosphate isomerase (TIM)